MPVLAAAVILADLCSAPPGPAAVSDPGDSAACTEVADAARAAGDLRTAAIAYRKAVALDGASRRAAAALAELCRVAGEASESRRAADRPRCEGNSRAGCA